MARWWFEGDFKKKIRPPKQERKKERGDEERKKEARGGGRSRGSLMLNHSPPAHHHLATIVLQDAGCTIVDLPEPSSRERGREEEGGIGKYVAIATEQEHV